MDYLIAQWGFLKFHIHIYSLSELWTFWTVSNTVLNGVLDRCVCSAVAVRHFLKGLLSPLLCFGSYWVQNLCLCLDHRVHWGGSWILVNVWHDGCSGPMLWKTWFHFTPKRLVSHPLDRWRSQIKAQTFFQAENTADIKLALLSAPVRQTLPSYCTTKAYNRIKI